MGVFFILKKMDNKIEKLKEQYESILEALKKTQKESNWEEFGRLQKEKERMEKIFKKEHILKDLEKKLKEAEEILEKEKDSQLIALAHEEKKRLQQEKETLQKEIQKLLEEEKNDESFDSVIVEIRAGAGGDEAALFAADLFNMYSKYAASQNWRLKVLDSHKTDLGGLKEIVFELSGQNVYSKMKFEGGVHRVQRIPETEKSGRIHTSTVSVAILPKPKKAQIQLKPEDLKIETFRASGPGGQYVNRRETAVRITHLPTGIVVACQSQRNQAANREVALSILQARILEQQNKKANEKLQKERRIQIGRMERSEKIRTYNFPQNRVTDHRIKKSWHNLEEILAGDLNPIIEELERSLK